jgi:hypothetical protein
MIRHRMARPGGSLQRACHSDLMSNTDHAEDRAKRAWEQIFTLIAAARPIPTGARPSTDAAPEELRNSLIVAAMALDEFLERGQLEPWRIRQSMLNLLLVCDSLVPLPQGLLPASDLQEVVNALRTTPM